ncbi:hypothetical protein D9M73_214170 [compost metagenome]
MAGSTVMPWLLYSSKALPQNWNRPFLKFSSKVFICAGVALREYLTVMMLLEIPSASTTGPTMVFSAA